jgi:hypothetical protein
MTVTRSHTQIELFLMAMASLGAGRIWAQDDANRLVSPKPEATQPALPQFTAKERARQYLKDVLNPLSFVESGASAAFGQWRDRPPEWGQGASGYFTRYASSFGQHITQESLKFGLASALHEDDRYVPSGKKKFVSRLLYALASTVRSRDYEGERQVSYSNIGSLAGASLLSRLWQPKSSGSAGDGAVNFGVAVAFSASINVAREFFPQRLRHK